MIDALYWKNVIEKLADKSEANWAANVLSSNVEILDEILPLVGRDNFIKSCLTCYNVDFSAQPYLDEVLSQFTISELVNGYKNLEKKPIETAGALMWLLEDIDPELGCIHS